MNFIRPRGAMTLAVALTTTAAASTAVAFAQAPSPSGAAENGAARSAGTTTAAKPAKAQKQRTRTKVRSVRRNVTLGNRSLVKGIVTPKDAGRRVRLQVRTGKGWTSVAKDVSGKGGRFRLRYTPNAPGSLKTRVVLLGDATHRSSRRAVGRVDVFRTALASWYGPGLYGNQLGCGGRLSPGTLGVAHKTLPCGTKVTIRYHGRSVRVPVIDRGPYVGNREYDLTAATRSRIGFSGTGAVQTTR